MSAVICARAQPGSVSSAKLVLPNGWTLSPAGKSLPLGDLPLNIAVSKNQQYFAVTNNGQSTQSIQLFDAKKDVQLDEIVISKSWYGLKFSSDGKILYAGGGNDNRVMVYRVAAGKLVLKDSISLGAGKKGLISSTGLDIDDTRNILYTVTKEDKSLYLVSLRDNKVVIKVPLPGEAFGCILSPDNELLYISCWGCDKLLVFNTKARKIINHIAVGDNPNELCLSRSGKWLYVANSNDNSVSVINTATSKVVETLNAALYPKAPSGSTTNGLALSPDEKTLYIANADNNCLAVFNVANPGRSFSKGFIPVGWYPTNVKVIGKRILVSNGKGFASMPNPRGPNPLQRKEAVIYQKGDTSRQTSVQYIAGLFKGTLSIIDVPSEKQLAVYSSEVYANTPYNKKRELESEGMKGNPIPMKVGGASPIKHVFYIIKENRTYDQVLGDLTRGNGDTSLVLFGATITPNQHTLAEQFVLLDNFYVDAEVSADGHNWSTGAYATDYLEKTWPTSYGGRGGTYDAEGNRAIANNKNGFIWDHCKRNSLSYRTYGEFADDGKANIPVLKNHVCNYFEGYNLSVKDSLRFTQWKQDFDSLNVIKRVPQFNTIRFGNDHTEGLRKGRPTPIVHVADNDLAVGMFVEHLSKSGIWNESVVFILEDDAQNGADHVDAHRSPVYVAGGFVKRKFVDHTMYSTSSVLRTIELILGMPPMTQYDAAAVPLWRCFDSVALPANFIAARPLINFNEKNIVINEWQRLSDSYNFTKEDAVPDVEFNKILWYAIKGSFVAFPGPRRAAFLKVNPTDAD